jgi:hypothetical protein
LQKGWKGNNRRGGKSFMKKISYGILLFVKGFFECVEVLGAHAELLTSRYSFFEK